MVIQEGVGRGPCVRAVLLVDNDAETLDVMSEFLTMHGWEVTQARRGQEALGFLQVRPFGAVVSDYELPDLTGPAVLEAAARLQPQARRIVFTGHEAIPNANYRTVNKPDAEALLTALSPTLLVP